MKRIQYKRASVADAAGHPLATSQGVMEHRRVLYGKIGGGVHACHWCQRPVEWRLRRAGAPKHRWLVADHVDGDRSNNNPSNLVPSCNACNGLRSQCTIRRVVGNGDIVVRNRFGAPWCRFSLGCGHVVYRRRYVAAYARCSECDGGQPEQVPMVIEVSPEPNMVGVGSTSEPPDTDAFGPHRRVVRELPYEVNGHLYSYWYLLECGHKQARNSPNKTICRCGQCRQKNPLPPATRRASPGERGGRPGPKRRSAVLVCVCGRIASYAIERTPSCTLCMRRARKNGKSVSLLVRS